ncbi:marginal zone B- and B1-cell-specific protein-like [Clavelina lepadiformis]|uniref:Marginal zone B-and B1-cell-specific protein n=1 Tax=Clavelina lepadiformis TaxID=159417 RepID=A0ABP0FQ89_CLALP
MLRLLGMFCLICTCWGQMGKPTVTKSKDGDPLSGTISMGPPDLSDEETQANYMPSKLRCDACAGIAARFAKALQKEIDKTRATRDGQKELDEGLLIDIFEQICADREWSNFGLKEVQGVNRISYPGSEIAEVPGIQQGGGIWPRRLSDMCYGYIEEFEEYGIYKAHANDLKKGLYQLICKKDCRLKDKKKTNKSEL